MTAVAEALLPTEQDERDELASIGISLDGPTSDAQLDAWASEICRELAAENADIARYTEAEAAEIGRIRMRYAALREPHERRVGILEAIGRDLARRADFGKRKSRKVGFGSYGRKLKSEAVKIVDRAIALEWFKANAPDVVVVETPEPVEKIPHDKVEPFVLQYLKETGEVPPGIEHTSESDEPWVKPA